jgi:creatinine amidohydrolase
MKWEELTSKNFAKAAVDCGGVCVLPIGVVEKHGDHLPLGTDMITGTEICRRAAEKEPAIVFPYYFFGQIAEATHCPGTLSVSHKLLMENLIAVCDEIGRNGLKKILIISSHGGNNYFLDFFAQEFPRLNRDYCVYVSNTMGLSKEQDDRFAEAAGTRNFGFHAGLTETSMIMHLRPDLVHMDEADIRDCADLGRLKDGIEANGIFTGFNWYASYPNHFAGDPTPATPELGRLLAEMVTDNIAAKIKAVKEDTVTPELSREYAERKGRGMLTSAN